MGGKGVKNVKKSLSIVSGEQKLHKKLSHNP